MEPSKELLLLLLGLLVGLLLGLHIDYAKYLRKTASRQERIARETFNKSTLLLRSMLWRQIWQQNVFIPLPEQNILDEIVSLLSENDQVGFDVALAQFRKSRAIGPQRDDYSEVSYSDEEFAKIEVWANELLSFL